MRESHKRASMREFSRREMSFISQESRSDPHGSGASPPQDVSRDDHDMSSEEEDTGKKRRDSFTHRITAGDRGRQFWSRGSEMSAVQSIAEETSEELKKEMSESTANVASNSERRLNSSFSNRMPNSFMMTPAGMVNSSEYAQRLNLSSGEHSLSSTESMNSNNNPTLPMVDSPRAMEQQIKVMEMTRKLMEDHERMMQATAAIMMEHKRLKEELEHSRELEKSSEFSSIDKSTELKVPSSAEEVETPPSRTVSENGKTPNKQSECTGVTEAGSDSSGASPDCEQQDA